MALECEALALALTLLALLTSLVLENRWTKCISVEGDCVEK